MSGAIEYRASPGGGIEPRRFLELLEGRAELQGEEPWLFFREGLGWRWWSWKRAWQSLTDQRTNPLGSALESHIGELRIHLERQATGRGGESDETGESDEFDKFSMRRERQRAQAFSRHLAPGCRRPGLAWRLLGLPRPRPLAVEGCLSEHPALRFMGWMWSAEHGAGLVLPSGSEDVVDTVMWSRPTVLWCDRRRLIELGERVLPPTRAARRARARLRRLSRVLVLVAGDCCTSADDSCTSADDFFAAVDPGSESGGPDDTAEASDRASAIGEELEDLGVEVVFWRVEGP